MANKIYVGQEGAQELYRRVKSLIPAVDQELDENSANPISNRAVTNAFKKFGGFRKVNGTGADNHPDVQNPDTKVIYLVEDPNVPNPDHFYEWIWEVPAEGNPIWRCIGTATVDLEHYYTKDEEMREEGKEVAVCDLRFAVSEIANRKPQKRDVAGVASLFHSC